MPVNITDRWSHFANLHNLDVDSIDYEITVIVSTKGNLIRLKQLLYHFFRTGDSLCETVDNIYLLKER